MEKKNESVRNEMKQGHVHIAVEGRNEAARGGRERRVTVCVREKKDGQGKPLLLL